ncbi:MAG: hypothetical protein WC331_05235 [Candidatus Omnitrophota bacterium]|jgi:hypothetical protein
MKKGLRVVATAVLVCFLTTQSVGAAPGAGIEMAGSRELPAYLSIDVPVELGTVDALYEAPAGANPQFVLHIQNAHANYQAQMKIKQLLQYMNKKYGFKTIFVEGASEKLDADYLRLFPDQERNLKLCDELAKQGELTGVELFLMEQGTESEVWSSEYGVKPAEKKSASGDTPYGLQQTSNKVEALGIEEAALYKANYDALKKVFGAATDVNRFFKGFDAKLDRVASKTFTPETRALIADWKRFEQGRRDFMPFVKDLAKKSKKIMNVDLESLFAQVGWPQISRLLVIQQMEKNMDKTKGVEEQFALLKDLRTKGVSKELLATLENFTEGSIAVGKSTYEVSPREVLERLSSEAGPKGFKFSDYPAFSLYAGYVTLRSELDPKVLFEEIEYLFTQMLDTLAKEPQQKALLVLYRDGELLRKLLHLELNRAQWHQAVEAKERIAVPSLVSRLKDAVIASGDAVVRKDQQVMPKVFSGKMDELFTAGLEFYDYAHKREAVFYKEMQTAMAERKITKAILITGGFHTDGMSDLFRENAISYGIVTPRLSEKSDEKFYRATMLQDREHLFSVSYLEMASKLMSDGVLAAQGIRLEEVYAVILNAMMKAGTTDIDEVATFNRSELAKSKHISLVRETNARGRPIKDRYRIVTRAMGEIPPAGVVRTPTTVPPRFDASRLDKNQIVNILLLRGPDGKDLAPNTKVEARVVSRRDDGVIFQIMEPVGDDARLNGARTFIRNDELVERVRPSVRTRETNVKWLSALFVTATALGGAVLTVPVLVATGPLFFTVIGLWAVLGIIGYRVVYPRLSRILDLIYRLTYRKEIGARERFERDYKSETKYPRSEARNVLWQLSAVLGEVLQVLDNLRAAQPSRPTTRDARRPESEISAANTVIQQELSNGTKEIRRVNQALKDEFKKAGTLVQWSDKLDDKTRFWINLLHNKLNVSAMQGSLLKDILRDALKFFYPDMVQQNMPEDYIWSELIDKPIADVAARVVIAINERLTSEQKEQAILQDRSEVRLQPTVMSLEDSRAAAAQVREVLRRAAEKGNVSQLHVAWNKDLKQWEIREATMNSKNVLSATNIVKAYPYVDNNDEVNIAILHYWRGQTTPQVLNIPAYADLAGFKSLDELLKKFSVPNLNVLPLEVREALFRPGAKVDYQQILVQPPVTRSETRKGDLTVSEEEDKLGNKRIVIQQNKTQIFSLNPKEGQPAAEKLARFLNGTLAFDYVRRTGFFVAKNGEVTQGAKTYQLDVKGLQDIVSEVQRSEIRSTIVERQKFEKEVWAFLIPEAKKRVTQTKFIISFRDLVHVLGEIVVPAESADLKLLTAQKVAMMLEVLVALKAGELNWNKFRQLAENIMTNEIMAVSDKVGGTVITMTDLPSDAEWDSVALMLGMNPRVLVRFVVINDQLSRAQKDVASQRVPVIREMRDYRENRIGDRISIDFAQSIKAVETVRHAASEVFRQLRKLDSKLDGGKYMSILFQDMPQLLGQEFIGTQVDSRKGDKKLAPVRNLIAMKAAQLNVSDKNISAMMLLNKQVGDDVLQFIRRRIARGYFGIDENKLAGLAKLWSDMLTRKATSVAA